MAKRPRLRAEDSSRSAGDSSAAAATSLSLEPQIQPAVSAPLHAAPAASASTSVALPMATLVGSLSSASPAARPPRRSDNSLSKAPPPVHMLFNVAADGSISVELLAQHHSQQSRQSQQSHQSQFAKSQQSQNLKPKPRQTAVKTKSASKSVNRCAFAHSCCKLNHSCPAVQRVPKLTRRRAHRVQERSARQKPPLFVQSFCSMVSTPRGC